MPLQTYHVIITNAAMEDLREISAFIKSESPQNASDVCAAIVKAIDSLATMPARFKRVGNSRKRGSMIHAMVVKPFNVYYRIDSSPPTVFILNVRRGARRPPRQFE